MIPEPKDPTPHHKTKILPQKDNECHLDFEPCSYDGYHRRMNSYDNLIKSIEELTELQKALENRCKVAEDLNKVYVRMYLEMQAKYDYLASVAAFDPFTTKPGSYFSINPKVQDYLENEEEYMN